MTLEAWVNPSTVDSSWRDVIYKGNDNYYLEATSTNASLPGAGMIAGGSYAHAFGTDRAAREQLVLPGRDLRRLDAAPVRQRNQVASTAHTGTIASSTNPLQIGGDSIYGQYFAGLIDEVRVYNVALTAAQIQTDQATPVNPADPGRPRARGGVWVRRRVGDNRDGRLGQREHRHDHERDLGGGGQVRRGVAVQRQRSRWSRCRTRPRCTSRAG